eukprot:1150260-Pelagomonas_calceolata.AAC.2
MSMSTQERILRLWIFPLNTPFHAAGPLPPPVLGSATTHDDNCSTAGKALSCVCASALGQAKPSIRGWSLGGWAVQWAVLPGTKMKIGEAKKKLKYLGTHSTPTDGT